MAGYLIKDTTREEREEIVRQSLGIANGTCDGGEDSFLEMYDDYIEGKKEITEINAAYRANYVRAEDERINGGCSYS